MRFVFFPVILVFITSCSSSKLVSSFDYPEETINQITSNEFSLRDYIIEKESQLQGLITLTEGYRDSYYNLKNSSNSDNKLQLRRRLLEQRLLLNLKLSERRDSLYYPNTLLQRQWRENKMNRELVDFKKKLRKGQLSNDIGYLEFLNFKKHLESLEKLSSIDKVEGYNKLRENLNLSSKPNSFIYSYYLDGYSIVFDSPPIRESYKKIKPLPVVFSGLILGFVLYVSEEY
jgi:hypothetical protein